MDKIKRLFFWCIPRYRVTPTQTTQEAGTAKGQEQEGEQTPQTRQQNETGKTPGKTMTKLPEGAGVHSVMGLTGSEPPPISASRTSAAHRTATMSPSAVHSRASAWQDSRASGGASPGLPCALHRGHCLHEQAVRRHNKFHATVVPWKSGHMLSPKTQVRLAVVSGSQG